MSAAEWQKCNSNGAENSLVSEEQQEKMLLFEREKKEIQLKKSFMLLLQIDEVRKLAGPFPDKLSGFGSDASISRYLRSQNWNVKKATKILKETLKWRLEYKPEAITWNEVAREAETGKMYRSNYTDKLGRTVIVMRPSRQNSKSVDDQIKHLVYCIENAIMNLPQNQEEIVWLVDFQGFSMSNISFKVSRETARVVQVYYPERLGIAVLYNAPKLFEPFYKLVLPFLETKTGSKVKFIYSDDPNSKKLMEEVFDTDQLESAFGGKANAVFNFDSYAERMKEEDKRMRSLWDNAAAGEAPHQPSGV